MSNSLTVERLFSAQSEALQLKWLAGCNAAERDINRQQVGGERPTLIGHLNLIRPNRIQIVGESEHLYLQSRSEQSPTATTRTLFEADSNIIIFSNDRAVPTHYIELADQYKVAIMRSPLPSYKLIRTLQRYIMYHFAERTTLHGVFMDVLGIGVLITGDSSVGKSELALELITRGHALVADDAPEFTRIAHDTLEGCCPALLRDFLEVRGLGILNIHKMYGDSSTRTRKIIKLIVHLEAINKDLASQYNRLEGDQTTASILDVPIGKITIPVAPGRNLAVLVEAGVRNYLLRKGGYISSEAMIAQQTHAIESKTQQRHNDSALEALSKG